MKKRPVKPKSQNSVDSTFRKDWLISKDEEYYQYGDIWFEK